MNWRLTSAQFMCLWEATDLDRMPYPLKYRSAAATEDQYAIQQRELEQWRSALDEPKLVAAIQALRNPQVSVTVLAPSPELHSGIRRRGSIRGRVAVVAEQLRSEPGRGDIRIDAGAESVDGFTDRLLDDLPDCAPGRTPSLTAHPDDVQNRGTGTSVLQNARASDGTRLRGIVGRPRTGIGYICIRGARSGLDEPVLGELTWIDVESDGRYLYHQDDRVHLRSATVRVVRDELSKRVAAALANTSANPSPTRG
ncbi:ESX secretion-associated protein EspG [Rhodococcus sp. USK10]|uniref:ESX secretion-associated protein EspG n=1 Tax=Rhodococcus sp. USK10 TaxID=2789739 RepID=UPI001C5FE5DE|nr:ESX secretion-associated protein EspG [Rhodococcus sp. USK10]QYB06353.1 ESX secretion-associated protein EspG [Rhodococcus sp. USK10]